MLQLQARMNGRELVRHKRQRPLHSLPFLLTRSLSTQTGPLCPSMPCPLSRNCYLENGKTPPCSHGNRVTQSLCSCQQGDTVIVQLSAGWHSCCAAVSRMTQLLCSCQEGDTVVVQLSLGDSQADRGTQHTVLHSCLMNSPEQDLHPGNR